MNPFISFCLYVAARVFVQYLKSRPKDTQIKASLQFLLSAMHAIKRKNPLTESFLVQLDVDLEGAGLENTSELRASVPVRQRFQHTTAGNCSAPATQQGEDARRPTYGDDGLAAYNDPNAATSIPMTTDAPVKGSTFGAYSVPGLRGQSNGADGFILGNAQFELQNRQQRSPGSQQSSGINPDMDTSPDGSGGNDRPTPNSSTQSQHNFSSHTSNSTYSPPNTQAPDMTSAMSSTATLFDQPHQSSDPAAFAPADFDMHNAFAQPGTDTTHHNGFVMWDADLSADIGPANLRTGFTPGPSSGYTPGPMPTMGFTPGEGGAAPPGMGDFVNGWSEADWNEFLASMDAGGGGQGGWETNVEYSVESEAVMHERMAKRGLIPRQQVFR